MVTQIDNCRVYSSSEDWLDSRADRILLSISVACTRNVDAR
jgi:hypothetical protein